MTASKHLSPGQLAALAKVGDILIPGDAEFPPFSRSGSLEHVDRMLDHMYAADRNGVIALLSIFRFTPKFLIRGLLLLTEKQRSFPEPLGQICRMINLGLKGVVMTLYYSDLGSGPSVLRTIHWDSKIVERDEKADAQVSEAG
jgi:hypothetical protein